MSWEEGRVYDKQAILNQNCGQVNPGLKIYGTNDKVLIFSPSTEYQPVRRGVKKAGNDRWEEDTIFILFLPVNSPENSSLLENSKNDRKAVHLFQKSGQNNQDFQYMGEFEYCGNKVADNFNALRLKSLEYAKKQKKLMEEQRKIIEQKEAREAQIANKISDALSNISKIDVVAPPKSSSSDRRSSSTSGRSSSSSHRSSSSSRYGRDSRDSRDYRDSRDSRDKRDSSYRDLRDSRDRSEDRSKLRDSRDSRDPKDSRSSRYSRSSSSYADSVVGQPWKDPSVRDKERKDREPPPPPGRRDWDRDTTMRDLRDAVSTGRSPRDSRDLRSSWGDSRDSGRGPESWDMKNNGPNARDLPPSGRDYPPRDAGPPASRPPYPPLRDSGPPSGQQQPTFGSGGSHHPNPQVPPLNFDNNRMNTDPYENQPRTPTKEPLDDSWTMYLVNNVIHQQ